MQIKIEGIVLSKLLYRDRDMICHLLLRNGKEVSILFYGGKGGGKHMKPSLLELGYMLQVELKNTKPHLGMYVANEWNILWQYRTIRNDYRAFYLLCFYLELLGKISVSDNLHDEHRDYDKNSEGIFRSASNALFYLEEAISKQELLYQGQLFLFLSRLIFEMGVLPLNTTCLFCGRSLVDFNVLDFVFDQGGFSCLECVGEIEDLCGHENTAKMTWRLLMESSRVSYRDYAKINVADKSVNILLFDYLCYQFNLKRTDFKTHQFVF